MRIIGIILLLLAISCTTAATKLSRFRAENRTNLMRLKPGITKEETLAIMGVKSVEISNKWQVGPANPNRVDAIYLNPHKNEYLIGPSDTIEVIYYYTELKRNDGVISDDELTPLVFRHDQLIGWGQSVLNDSVRKYEIRFR